MPQLLPAALRASRVCSGVGAVVTIMGGIVAAVREFVRDLIADAVGRLVVWGLDFSSRVVPRRQWWRWRPPAWSPVCRQDRGRGAQTAQDHLQRGETARRAGRGAAHGLAQAQGVGHRLRRKDPGPQHKDPREVDRQRREREKQELIDEALRDGVKLDPEKVVEIGKDPNGKIVFLEEGGVNPRTGKEAGLAHVMKHKDEFVAAGIPEDKIADVVHRAATEGRYTGYCQGSPPGRPIFEVEYGGQTHYMSVQVGNNGFIVGANMRSANDPFDGARRDPRAETDENYRGWGR